MEEHFTGRSIDVITASKSAENIVVAKFSDTGNRDVGAPGESYYDNAKLQVMRWLRSDMPEDRRPATLTVAYTVQVLPESSAEQPPTKARVYLIFLVGEIGHSLRALKILPGDDEVVRSVERALGLNTGTRK